MFEKIFSILLLLVIVVEAQNDCKYLKFSANHTMCKPKNESCTILNSGVSASDNQLIVDTHNKLRQKVASGEETRNSQPPAANMRKMVWDEELAAVAQRLTDQCRFAFDCAECRQVERFQPGQNLHMYSFHKLGKGDRNWKDVIEGWYNRVEKFDASTVDKFQFSAEYSTYSQVIWADSQFVGCGFTSYPEEQWIRNLYICNYGPSGNIIGGSVYLKGSGCSQCPNGTSCSDVYPGLCQNQMELDFRVLEKKENDKTKN